MVHVVAKRRVPELIETDELIEAARAPVRQDKPMKGDGESRFANGLHRFCLTQHPRPSWDQHLLSTVRIDGICDEAVHRGGVGAIRSDW